MFGRSHSTRHRPRRHPMDKAHLIAHYLGVSTLLVIVGAIWLVHESVVSENQTDASAVALTGGIVSIATLTIGGLIGMAVGKAIATRNTPDGSSMSLGTDMSGEDQSALPPVVQTPAAKRTPKSG